MASPHSSGTYLGHKVEIDASGLRQGRLGHLFEDSVECLKGIVGETRVTSMRSDMIEGTYEGNLKCDTAL